MNIEQTILYYETMQAVAESIADDGHPDVEWVSGEHLRLNIADSDIRPVFMDDVIQFSGLAWTNRYGGGYEPFEFHMPTAVFEAMVNERLAV